jgi:hypothetical protein
MYLTPVTSPLILNLSSTAYSDPSYSIFRNQLLLNPPLNEAYIDRHGILLERSYGLGRAEVEDDRSCSSTFCVQREREDDDPRTLKLRSSCSKPEGCLPLVQGFIRRVDLGQTP